MVDYPQASEILNLLIDMICVVDAEGRYVFVSAASHRLLGYSPEELLGRSMIELVHPDDRERTLRAAANVMHGHSHLHFENRYIRKDGRIVHIMWSACRSESNQIRLAVARDVTSLKHAERLQNALYRISEAAHMATGLPELYRRIHQVIADLLPADNFLVAHYDPTDGMLSFPYFVDQYRSKPQPQPLDVASPIATVIRGARTLLTHCDTNPCAWLGAPLFARKDVIGALVARTYSEGAGYTDRDKDLLEFISTQIGTAIERKRAELRLHYLASHDTLTELPNRALFCDRLDTALKRARRDGEHLSLLYVDLNGFKQINDTHGHDLGDQLLCAAAKRLVQCVRESDTVGRMGGDEFTLLLINIKSASHAHAVMKKIHEVIEAPFELEGRTVHLSASIGAAIYPEHGQDRRQLFRHADADMYAAKHSPA